MFYFNIYIGEMIYSSQTNIFQIACSNGLKPPFSFGGAIGALLRKR